MERHRGVNLRYSGGGDPLCTLLRAEGLYGQVRYWGYMRDSRLKKKQVQAGRHQPHRRDCTAEGPSSVLYDPSVPPTHPVYGAGGWPVVYFAPFGMFVSR